MAEQIRDVRHWLATNEINYRWAMSMLHQIKKEYPFLAQALKDNRNNRAELDLVLMMHHTLEGRFPVNEHGGIALGASNGKRAKE